MTHNTHTPPTPYDEKDAASVDAVDVVEKDSGESEPLRSHWAHLTPGEARRKFTRRYLMALSMCIGGMYVGYSIVAPGNVVANPGFIKVMGTRTNPKTGKLELDAVIVSLWSGFTILGQVFGMALAPISDYIGRKPTLWIMSVTMVVAIVLEMVANDWKVFLGGKVVSGVSTGLAQAAITTVCAELSMPQMRGTVMGAFALGYSFGQLPCAIGLEVLQKTAPSEYRRIFYSQFTIVGLWLIPLIMVPESPVWLAGKGKHERGKKALAKLVGNVEGFDLDHEYAVIVDEVERSRRIAAPAWKTLFVGSNLKRTIATSIVPALQYFIGVPLIYGQTTYFFQIAGLEDPFLGNLIITVLTVVFVVVGNWFILDRAPRRTALLTAIVGSAAILCIVGGLGFLETTPKVAAALIAMCSLWVAVYSCTFAPVYWVTLGEIPSPSVRQKTITVALIHMSAWGCMWKFVVPILLSPQQAGLQTKTAFVFAGTQVIFFPIIYFFLPETKGRSSPAIDEMYERGISPRKFAQTKTVAEGTLVDEGEA